MGELMRYTAITVAAILTIAARPVATPRVSAQAAGPAADRSSRSSSTKRRPSRACTPRPSSRRATGWWRPVRGHARRGAGRRHLGLASRQGRVDGAGRGRDRRAARRHAPPVLEPGAVRDAGSLARALLQGRPRPAQLVGRRAHVDRRRADVGRRPAAARRRAGPDQEQARAARRWHDHQPEQQRIERQAEPLAHPFRALDRRRTDVDHCPAGARRGQRARAARHPAEHARVSRRQAAGGRAGRDPGGCFRPGPRTAARRGRRWPDAAPQSELRAPTRRRCGMAGSSSSTTTRPRDERR